MRNTIEPNSIAKSLFDLKLIPLPHWAMGSKVRNESAGLLQKLSHCFWEAHGSEEMRTD